MGYTVEERDQLLSRLNDAQQSFLKETMKRGRRTEFARQMAKKKGMVVPEQANLEEIELLLDEWRLVDYQDSGFRNPETPCLCGIALRHQYTVEHRSTGHVMKLGITHLETHTGIDAKTVGAIVRGFEAIDLELDEILGKIEIRWNWLDSISFIPPGFLIPGDIQAHLDVDLPLLDRHVIRLRQQIRQFQEKPPVPQSEPEPEPLDTDPVPPVDPPSGQFEFDLFDDFAAESNRQDHILDQTDYSRLLLPERLQQAVLDSLRQNVTSARVICELLIKHEGASDERYSSGKPKLFPAVCYFIDRFVSREDCERVSGDQIDRTYRWKGTSTLYRASTGMV